MSGGGAAVAYGASAGLLTGRVALITGASRGIGRAIARSLAACGADVVLAARSETELMEVSVELAGLGRRALAVRADVSRVADIDRLVGEATGQFGRIDILVNSAGISPIYKSAERVTEEEWDHIVDINLKGAVFCCLKTAQVMMQTGGGRIINVASAGGMVALPRLLAYCSSKGGLLQATRVMAIDWAPYNIQVNAIAPGWVDTGFVKGLRENEKIYAELKSRIPAGRFATPEEIAGAAVYLASEASRYATGSTLVVDGGWSAW